MFWFVVAAKRVFTSIQKKIFNYSRVCYFKLSVSRPSLSQHNIENPINSSAGGIRLKYRFFKNNEIYNSKNSVSNNGIVRRMFTFSVGGLGGTLANMEQIHPQLTLALVIAMHCHLVFFVVLVHSCFWTRQAGWLPKKMQPHARASFFCY